MIADSIGTKMDNINGGKFRINYINVNHLVQLYDVKTMVINVLNSITQLNEVVDVPQTCDKLHHNNEPQPTILLYRAEKSIVSTLSDDNDPPILPGTKR